MLNHVRNFKMILFTIRASRWLFYCFNSQIYSIELFATRVNEIRLCVRLYWNVCSIVSCIDRLSYTYTKSILQQFYYLNKLN